MDWRRGGRSGAPSRSNSPPRRTDFDAIPAASTRIASRRGSRVARQHSYDDDMKSSSNAPGTGGGGGVPGSGTDMGLGIPSMPRW